jgi:tetratricopeptide (TPR) repeat protein
MGRTAEAQDALVAGVRLLSESNDRHGEGQARTWLAALYKNRGQMTDAHVQVEAALLAHRSVLDLHGEATALGTLGSLLREQGEIDAAQDAYRRALEGHIAVGNRSGEASVRGDMGTLALHRGELQAAQDAYAACLSLHRELGDLRRAGVVLGNLAMVLDLAGQTQAARLRNLEASPPTAASETGATKGTYLATWGHPICLWVGTKTLGATWGKRW